MVICISADRQRVHELLASPAVRTATALKKQRVERREVPPRQTVLTEPQRQAAAAAAAAAAAYAASPAGKDEAAKKKGAVLCVEGAGSAEWNGYYKEDGASAPFLCDRE